MSNFLYGFAFPALIGWLVAYATQSFALMVAAILVASVIGEIASVIGEIAIDVTAIQKKFPD